MANGIHDVFNEEIGGIAPNLLRQMAAAQRANTDLSALDEQKKRAELLRGTATPEMVGMTAANPLEFIAAGYDRYRGNQQLNDMQAQAQELRGEVAGGEDARMMADQQRFQYGEDQEAKLLADERAYKDRVRGETFTHDQAIADQKAAARGDELVTNYAPWINEETGEITNFARTRNETVDENKNRASTEGFVPMKDSKWRDKGINSKTPVAVTKAIIDADTSISNYNSISKLANSFNDEDLASLQEGLVTKDKAFNDVLIGAITPESFQTYANNNLRGYTPKAKRLLQKIAMLDADVRHELFGSALTPTESVRSDQFLSGATGLTFEDTMRRLQGMVDKPINYVGSVDRTLNSNYAEKLLKPIHWSGLAAEREQLVNEGVIDGPQRLNVPTPQPSTGSWGGQSELDAINAELEAMGSN